MEEVILLPKLDEHYFDSLYEMLNKITIKGKTKTNNRRGFPINHKATTFGYIRKRYSGKYELSAMSEKHPHIYNELLRIGKEICPFEFESIYVNKCVVCPKHVDDKNDCQSLLVSFGEYTGCNIVIGAKEYNTKNQPIIFDGSKLEHYNTDDLIGNKISLVFFNNFKKVKKV